MRIRTTAIALLPAICLAGSLSLNAAEPAATLGKWGRLIDPDKDCRATENGRTLTIAVPARARRAHDLGAEVGLVNAPRVLTNVDGDFLFEVKVSARFEPRQAAATNRAAYHGAGVLIMKDERTYLRLDRGAYYVPQRSQTVDYANFELRLDGEIARFGAPGDLELPKDRDVFLRVERRGDEILGAVSLDGARWSYLPSKFLELPRRLSVGVAAVSTAKEAFSPSFSERRLLVEPGAAE